MRHRVSRIEAIAAAAPTAGQGTNGEHGGARYAFAFVPPSVEHLIQFRVKAHVSLRVNCQMLVVLFVIENNCVVILLGRAPHTGRFETAKLLMCGQAKPRHVLRIINAADNQWLVRITLLKNDHYLVADARPEERTPALAGPHLGHAQPAGAVGVLLPLTVPVELHLHAAILVAEDFLAARANYCCGLYPGDHRFARHALRAVRQRDGDTSEAVRIIERQHFVAAVIAVEVGIVFDASQKVPVVGIEMALEREVVPGNEVPAIALAYDSQAGSFFLLHANLCGPFAVWKNLL